MPSCSAWTKRPGSRLWTAPCRKRHRHQEWLAFLRLIDRETPEGLDLHLVCDNYGTRKHAKVRA